MLELKQVTKTYASEGRLVTALNHFSIQVAAGESVALIGQSGSGKSTVLNIAGLIDEPNGGEVWFEGRNLTTVDQKHRSIFRRDQLGYVFQNFHLVPVLSVRENVMLPALLQGKKSSEAARDADFFLHRVGLKGFESRKPYALSGGQRQRTAIARALVNRPRLILADEPTANLDSHSGQQVCDLLFELCAEGQSALLFVTHDPGLVPQANRTVCIKDGRSA